MRTRSILGAVAPCALLGACSSYKAPELSVAEVRLKDETPSGYVLEFDLDTRNDNSEPLPLREVRYSLTLDGRPVFTGVRSAQATLRRFGTQRISLPAAVALEPGESPPDGVIGYALVGELSYVTPGQIARILFDTRVRRPRVSFRKQGELDLGNKAAEQQNSKAADPGR